MRSTLRAVPPLINPKHNRGPSWQSTHADGGEQINHFSLRLETLVGRLWRQEARRRTAYLALLLQAEPSSTSSAKAAPLFTPGPD